MFLSEKKSIGLDISDKSIEIVEVEKSGDQILILAKARVVLDPGIVEFGRIKQPEKLKEIITNLLAGSKGQSFSAGRIVFGLPENQVFLRNFVIKNKQKSLINSLILRELQYNVPAKDTDLLWTYRVIDCKLTPADCRIFLVAVVKDFFIEWNNFLSQFGWGKVIFDVETLANCRSLFNTLPAPPTILLDIGSAYSNIFVYDQTGLLYSYSHPVAGDTITKKIISSVPEEISWMIAENTKTKINLSSAGTTESAVQEVIDDILKEVKNVIEFCEQKYTKNINRLVLLGGGSRLPEIDRYCQNYFDKNNKKIEISLGKSIVSGEDDSYFLESIGLAMRGVGVELPNDIDLSVIKIETVGKMVMNKRMLWIEENLKLLMFSAVFVCFLLLIGLYYFVKYKIF